MEINEKQAYLYWEFFKIVSAMGRIKDKKLFEEDSTQRLTQEFKDRLGLDDPIERLMEKPYLDVLIQKYGRDLESTPIPALKAIASAKKAAGVKPEYRCFTEIVIKSKSELSPSYALQSWFRNRNTLELLSSWEQKYNPSFNAEAAQQLKLEMESKNSAATLKKWIEQTDATGIAALQGRYGGTYAHPVIALDFECWLSPQVKLDIFDAFLDMKQLKIEQLLSSLNEDKDKAE